MIVYHGTTSKFDHFDLAHLGEGEGKSKFGVGHYASSVYDTAALYAGKCKGSIQGFFMSAPLLHNSDAKRDHANQSNRISKPNLTPSDIKYIKPINYTTLPFDICSFAKYFLIL
jgi:hypothetical protein